MPTFTEEGGQDEGVAKWRLRVKGSPVKPVSAASLSLGERRQARRSPAEAVMSPTATFIQGPCVGGGC